MAYPQYNPGPNGWQIFGTALQQGGQAVDQFVQVQQNEAEKKNRLQLLMEDAALKKQQAEMARIKADRDAQIQQAEEARKAAEAAQKAAEREKSSAVRDELAAGKTVPGKSVGGVVGPDEVLPYSPEEANRMLLKSGDLSGKEYSDSQKPDTKLTLEDRLALIQAQSAAAAGRPLTDYQKAMLGLAKDRAETGAETRNIAREGKQFDQEQKLQEKFLSQTKDYRDVRDAYGRIQVSAKDPSPAGDLALIFNYMKMLDPGSTVRESEFASAAASGSYGDRIQAAASKLINGERLSSDQRKDFLDRAKSLYVQQAQQAKKTESETKKQARSYNLNESRVVTDVGIAKDQEPTTGIRLTGEKGRRLAELRAKAAAGSIK